MSASGWGEESWGSGSWGGGATPGLDNFGAVATRENAIRVEFDDRVYLSGLFDAADASLTSKWSVLDVTDTVGADGEPARSVGVVRVEYAGEADGVAPEDVGRFILLTLDRPMSPYPAQYDVAWDSIFSEDLGSETTSSSRIFGLYRRLELPTFDAPSPARDFANPQTRSNAGDPLPDPDNPLGLGTYRIDDTGDYAFDEGLESLKKRIIRRLVTKKGGFVHLPEYGVGIPYEGKKLGTSATLSRLRSDAEIQISQEPDVDKAKVTVVVNPDTPGLFFFRIAVRSRVGKAFAFTVPFRGA